MQIVLVHFVSREIVVGAGRRCRRALGCPMMEISREMSDKSYR